MEILAGIKFGDFASNRTFKITSRIQIWRLPVHSRQRLPDANYLAELNLVIQAWIAKLTNLIRRQYFHLYSNYVIDVEYKCNVHNNNYWVHRSKGTPTKGRNVKDERSDVHFMHVIYRKL